MIVWMDQMRMNDINVIHENVIPNWNTLAKRIRCGDVLNVFQKDGFVMANLIVYLEKVSFFQI